MRTKCATWVGNRNAHNRNPTSQPSRAHHHRGSWRGIPHPVAQLARARRQVRGRRRRGGALPAWNSDFFRMELRARLGPASSATRASTILRRRLVVTSTGMYAGATAGTRLAAGAAAASWALSSPFTSSKNSSK